MRRRRDFYEDESQSMGLGGGGLLGGGFRGSGMRSPGRGSRFWQPSDALSSQPFFGFPGGQPAWEQWRSTGQMPSAGPLDSLVSGAPTPPAGGGSGGGRPPQLTPEQSDFYFRLPEGHTPMESRQTLDFAESSFVYDPMLGFHVRPGGPEFQPTETYGWNTSTYGNDPNLGYWATAVPSPMPTSGSMPISTLPILPSGTASAPSTHTGFLNTSPTNFGRRRF